MNTCEYLSTLHRYLVVQCYIVVKWQAFITSPSKAIFELFSREMLLLHSHFNHQCHRITCCFEGFILIYVSIQAHYVVWSSSEAPQPLFSAKSIFFFQVWRLDLPTGLWSDPDTPLEKIESVAWRGWRVTFVTEIITCFECWSFTWSQSQCTIFRKAYQRYWGISKRGAILYSLSTDNLRPRRSQGQHRGKASVLGWHASLVPTTRLWPLHVSQRRRRSMLTYISPNRIQRRSGMAFCLSWRWHTRWRNPRLCFVGRLQCNFTSTLHHSAFYWWF